VKRYGFTAVGTSRGSARQPTRFFASPKKWGKKGDPYDGGPLRGLHASSAPETGSVRNSLALRQRTLLYPFQALTTRRHLTGIHCNGNGNFISNGNGNGDGNGNDNGNGNGRCAGLTATTTATVAARATALVASGNSLATKTRSA
jgi:hypothetical protein